MTKIKGGYLERPVFLFNDGVDKKVCENLILDEPGFAKFKTDPPGTKNYTQIAPLFQFLINIKKECLNNEGIIILQDVDGNHIFISENLTDDDNERKIHIFQLTDKYQILYTGQQKYKDIKESIFTFGDFINENKKRVNDKYSLFDMKIAYDKNMILKIYQKYYDIQKPEFQEKNKIKFEEMNGFIKFMEKYCSPHKDTNNHITNIIYHENYNIINFMAFINMMPELFELIELDYKHYNDYDDVSKICPELDELIKKSDMEQQLIKSTSGISYKLLNIDIYEDIYYDLHLSSILNKEKIKMLQKTTQLQDKKSFGVDEYLLELEYINKTTQIKTQIMNKEKEEKIKINEKEEKKIQEKIKIQIKNKIITINEKEKEQKIKEETEKKIKEETEKKIKEEIEKKRTDLEKIIKKIQEQIDEEKEDDITQLLNYKKNKEIKTQKDILKNMIYIKNTEKYNILREPIYISYLYDKIIKKDLEYEKEKLYDEYNYNYIKKFRYALCLLSKIPNMNKDEIFDKITYAYNYKEIGAEILSIERLKQEIEYIKKIKKDSIITEEEQQEEIKRKQNEQVKTGMIQKKIDLINKLIDDTYYKKRHHYFDFIVEIIEFLDDLHNIRREFVSYNICFYNEFVKLFIGQCYFNYLKEGKFLYLPFSIKSHSKRYYNISVHDENLPILFSKEDKYYMPLIKEKQIIISDNELENRFNSCGETNLLNFIKYILTDTSEKKITQQNIEYLNRLYKDHNLREIFDDELIKQGTDVLQTGLLENRLNKFAEIISKDENKIIYNRGVCELKPSFENSMYILQKILGIKKEDIDKEGEIFIKELSEKFDKKYEKTEDGKIVYNDEIKFFFNELHAETTTFALNLRNEIIAYYSNNLLIKLIDNTNLLYFNFINYIFIENTDFDWYKPKNNIIRVIYYTKYYLEFNNCFKIMFDFPFDENISEDVFTNVKIITNIYTTDNKPIIENVFPSCEKVEFGENFNANIPATSFRNVKEIKFGKEYNQPINNECFSKCEKVEFGTSFNANIPATAFRKVKEIKFGKEYNQPINNECFPSCEKVEFGTSFNAEISATSFRKVKEIKFGKEYNQPINNECFPSCEKVEFGTSFNAEISETSFRNVKEIKFGDDYNQPIRDGAFSTCSHVEFGDDFNNFIPITALKHVTIINFGVNYNQSIIDNAFLLCKYVSFGYEFNSNIPASSFKNVKEIIFGQSYNQPINDNVFNNCEKVTFGKMFNTIIPESSFKNVKEIIFGQSYNQPINDNAFNNCEKVKFGQLYNQPINNNAFPSCKTVFFGRNFNASIPETAFKSIEHIYYNNYDKIINLYDGKIMPVDRDLLTISNLKKILDSDLMKRLKEKENEIKIGGSNNYKQKYLKYKQKYLNLKNKLLFV